MVGDDWFFLGRKVGVWGVKLEIVAKLVGLAVVLEKTRNKLFRGLWRLVVGDLLDGKKLWLENLSLIGGPN